MDSSDMITRKQYMETKTVDGKRVTFDLHQAYFLQFATNRTRVLVLSGIGKDRILASTDPHFNDIPLKEWDDLNRQISETINQRLKGQAEGFPEGKFGWSDSDSVCIAKAVAREYKESGQ